MNVEVQYSGRLRHFVPRWQQITDDPIILEWLDGYKIPFHSTPFRYDKPSIYPKNSQEHKHFSESIASLLRINAISKCVPTEQEFLSSVFLVPKSNGDKRFILNLKCLNKFVRKCHFKMEDYRTASKLITKDCYMTSIDMKDAYFLVPIHSDHKKFLRFKYNDILYEFNCLPFGLSTAPYVFTKLLKPVMQYLRSNNFASVIFLDDILCIDRGYTQCQQNTIFTKNILESLGFVINHEKSCLIPKRECTFLGFIFDSKDMSLKLPEIKRNKIKERLQHITKLKQCKLRDYASFLGLLTSACPAIQYGWLYTKELERLKYLRLLDNLSYEQTIDLPTHINDDITWWIEHIQKDVNPFKFNDFKLEIFSDASTTGWGAFCENNECHGFWKNSEKEMHINTLELKAAFFALKVFARGLRNCEILMRIDNVTAISCINRMGSVQYPHLNDVAKEIWQWCERRKLVVFASYINTKENREADILSRKKFIDTEWELCDLAFQKIVDNFGQPSIDLFASMCNAKCPVYVSWKNDPDAWAVDAFTISWSNVLFYAFPPFALILKMLQKIIHDKAEGIVVVPYWPTQPWFPILQKVMISDSLHFGPDIKLLKSPFRLSHNLHKTLTLVAVKLSGKLY